MDLFDAPGMAAVEAAGAARFLPAARDLASLRAAATACEGCPLWEPATQTVFGEGPPAARLVLVGEQPGDHEDLAGRPFVGPAGQLLDRCLVEAGIDRAVCYVTNAVKHFKFTIAARGKRRMHATPGKGEVAACAPWLAAELAALTPSAIVCLGATAAQALLGPGFRITQGRGRPLPSNLAPLVLATWHPSAVLRAPDEAQRARQTEDLVADLRLAAAAIVQGPDAPSEGFPPATPRG